MKAYFLISILMQITITITIIIKSTIRLTSQILHMVIHTFQMLFYILHFGKYFLKVFGKWNELALIKAKIFNVAIVHFPKCKQFDFGDVITCKQKKKWRKTTLSCHVHFSNEDIFFSSPNCGATLCEITLHRLRLYHINHIFVVDYLIIIYKHHYYNVGSIL
ncbi:hypothetical protein RFI_32466 [Reticulomyxa filosa]|uniref:Uncharacterized protein n=1 Tax=Reticulomyxa filosa TaxID=46433 RepID=X6LUA1_RETFI|nr:hypothetical protein RFI_32466 [Reticulomyxa filosa]|eukprot:ETO04931.1 hypothetical protein RFI_32466 [Reticulomyxa filosa]